MVELICTVRNCGNRLARHERGLSCARGHNFDMARSGYFNLLQPQDKRSKNPGDTKQAVAARHRFLLAGYETTIVNEIISTVNRLNLSDNAAILDAGCGEGFYLAALSQAQAIEGYGVDISLPAIELAAKNHHHLTWLITNVDRLLPFADRSFQLVMSITARRNSREYHRVLIEQGYLLVVIPAADDLIELRELVMGERLLKDRSAQTIAAYQAEFELIDQRNISSKNHLSLTSLQDILAATYRGARNSQQENLTKLAEMEITLSRELLLFRRKE